MAIRRACKKKCILVLASCVGFFFASAVEALEGLLGLEQLELARSAGHEEPDHALGLRDRELRVPHVGQAAAGEPVAPGQGADAAGAGPQDGAAGEVVEAVAVEQ